MILKGSNRNQEYALPNMVDYANCCEDFSWTQVEQELKLDPDGHWNIAVEAISSLAMGRKKNKFAFRFFDGESEQNLTYRDLELFTNKFANVLKNLKIYTGERIALYLPPTPEFYISFLGSIKAGIIAVPLAISYMSDAVTQILNDSEVSIVVTTEDLLHRVVLENIPSLKYFILIDRLEFIETNNRTGFKEINFIDYSKAIDEASSKFTPTVVEKTTSIMLLYTSGSTGKPKGVIHTHAGLIHYYQTGKWVLDLHEKDIFWCTSEPSWIPGISYGIFAALLNGVTSIVYSGTFNEKKYLEVLERYAVNVWYTTPTVLRRLMNYTHGQLMQSDFAQNYKFNSLRHILSVGEPLNPSVIRWCRKVFRQNVYDTWWMTETGGQLIGNFKCIPVKVGSMGKPFPGITAGIVDDKGNELPDLEVGQLAIKPDWPAMMKGIWKDEVIYERYFHLKSWYLTGDLAYRDADGYFWFQGRLDDVIKKAGERIGPFEIENKLNEHPAVLETGVIGKPDPLWGEIIKAFIVLRTDFNPSDDLQCELIGFISKRLGPSFVPDEIEFCSSLPHTRSGKIIRRLLKARELGFDHHEEISNDDN